MSQNTKLRYADFKSQIDVDAFEEAIGFSVISQDGGNDIGHCLFPQNHTNGDSTGKFAIHREKMVYNCWVCDGGDLLSLVMELYDWPVEQATDWLYQFSQHDLRSDAEFTSYLMGMLQDSEKRAARMPYFNERVLGRFTAQKDYFRTRGISDRVIDEYKLCYSEYEMKPSPMKVVDGEKTKVFDDYFGPVAIFPHYWNGKLVGWQHRWMDWDEDHTNVPRWLPKYTNTTDFPKSTTVFNYDRALNRAVEQKNPVVLVESVATCLFLETFEIPAVCCFGNSPDDAQLRLLRRFGTGVILSPDNDKASDKLIEKADYLQRFIPVWVAEPVTIKPKADLNDYAETSDPELNVLEHLTDKIERVEVKL
jgi:DNA primase